MGGKMTFIRTKNVNIILIITLLIITACSHILFADETDSDNRSYWADKAFGVSSYIPEKFTDFQFRIDGGLALRGSNSDRKNDYDNASSNQNLNFGSVIEYIHETIPRFYELGMSLDIDFMNRNGDNAIWEENASYYSRDSEYNEKGFTVRLRPNAEFGQYWKGDLFMALSFSGDLSYSKSTLDSKRYSSIENEVEDNYIEKTESHYDDEYELNANNYNINLAVTPGWGRIYYGDYAATAMYIIDEFKKNSFLLNEPTDQQMSALSDTIHLYRKLHIIDNRIRLIESNNAITEYLVNEGIIADPGAYGGYIIHDIWQYYPTSNRKFGFRVRAGMGLDYFYGSGRGTDYNFRSDLKIRYDMDNENEIDTLMYNEYEYDRLTHTKRSKKYPYLYSKIEYSKPLNMRWQFDSWLEMHYYLDAKEISERWKIRYDNPENNSDSRRETDYNDYYEIECVSEIRYIIDSRTSANLTGKMIYQTHWRDTYNVYEEFRSIIDRLYIESLDIIFNLNLTYRIAIPTELRLSGSFSYHDIESGPGYVEYDAESRNYSITAKISHYLF
jgi:hypothetical protein